MDYEALKKRIISKLKERNLSIASAEKLAGLGKGCLYSFCYGRTKSPTLETLDAISQALNYDLAELLDIDIKRNVERAAEPINFQLYCSIFKIAKDFFLEKEISLENEFFLNSVKEIYYFCLSKKMGILDIDFANWHLQTELDKKNSKTLGQSDFL